MDDPTRRCENDTGIETRLPGLLVPSGSPIFFRSHFPTICAEKLSAPLTSLSFRALFALCFYVSGLASPRRASCGLVHSASDGDARLAEHVRHLGIAQTRGVIFEGELVFLLVHVETPQAVSVRKIAQPA
jgi:hypothetical protein